MKFKTSMLINTEFGGFSIPIEIVLWLNENKGWELPNKYYNNKEDNSKFLDICGDTCHLKDNSVEIRSNPELIEAYKICKTEWANKNLTYSERRYSQMRKLRLVDVTVEIEIEDYYDGKERVTSYVRQDDNEFEKYIYDLTGS